MPSRSIIRTGVGPHREPRNRFPAMAAAINLLAARAARVQSRRNLSRSLSPKLDHSHSITRFDRSRTGPNPRAEHCLTWKGSRNPRRAYDEHGREIEPMTLGNMRAMGVRSMDATCEDCRHEATVNVDALPDHLYVPDVALRMRCSACGSKRIITRPDWREHKAVGRG